MSRDKGIPQQLEPLSDRPLCVRFESRQELAIERLASEYGVSQARVARYLVGLGLDQYDRDERAR